MAKNFLNITIDVTFTYIHVPIYIYMHTYTFIETKIKEGIKFILSGKNKNLKS